MAKPAAGKTQKQKDDDKLDEALEESFPASDPPAQTDPTSHIDSDGTSEPARRK